MKTIRFGSDANCIEVSAPSDLGVQVEAIGEDQNETSSETVCVLVVMTPDEARELGDALYEMAKRAEKGDPK